MYYHTMKYLTEFDSTVEQNNTALYLIFNILSQFSHWYKFYCFIINISKKNMAS